MKASNSFSFVLNSALLAVTITNPVMAEPRYGDWKNTNLPYKHGETQWRPTAYSPPYLPVDATLEQKIYSHRQDQIRFVDNGGYQRRTVIVNTVCARLVFQYNAVFRHQDIGCQTFTSPIGRRP